MTNYEQIPHIGCGGNLTFEKTQVEEVVLNKREVKRFGMPKKIKTITKQLYRCDKCNSLVTVISCPSWEKLVLMGRIKVTPETYRAIKRNRKDGILRF